MQAQAMVTSVQRGVRLCPASQYVPRALSIALELSHPVYDCLYLACAEALGDGVVVTADNRLVRAMAGGPYARRIVHLPEVAGPP